MVERTVVYCIKEMSDLDFHKMTMRDNSGEALEITYQTFRRLREIARNVLAEKITKKMSYEEVCNAVLFSFDNKHQQLVADQLGISLEILKITLIALSTGARLQWQKK